MGKALYFAAGLFALFFILFEGSVQAQDEFKLDNGLTVVYEYIPHTGITSVQAWIDTGSVNENARNNGISHFLEHILFKGTKNFKPDEIDTVVEGAGGVMNAGTSKDYTTYYITLPSKNAETAFKVISDMIFKASFIPSEIDKEKPVVAQEILRKFDSPTYDMFVDAVEALSWNTPYAREVIGTEENVNSFDKKSLSDYYRTHYHPAKTTLVVVGDIDRLEVNRLAKNYFSTVFDIAPVAGYNAPWNPVFKGPSEKEYGRDVAQDYALVGYQTNAVAKDAPIYEILSEILSGGEYSLLNMELKQKGAVTSVSAFDMLNKGAGAYMIYLVANPGEGKTAVGKLDAALKKITAGKLEEQELQKAKNRLISRTLFRKEKSGSLASEIGYSYTLGLKDYHLKYTKLIEAVTAKDVVDSARVLFSSPRLVYITKPKKEVKETQ